MATGTAETRHAVCSGVRHPSDWIAQLHRIRVHALTGSFSLQAVRGTVVASALRSSSSRERAGGRAVGCPPPFRCETAGMRFAELAATTEAVRATGGRREKVERLAEA